MKSVYISQNDGTLLTAHGCTDHVVGDILSGWRYDISGVSPEMRVDYERHLEECDHCRSRQRLHRSIDVGLMALSTVSVVVFLLASAYIYRVHLNSVHLATVHLAGPGQRHLSIAVTTQAVALAGLLFSMFMWVLVAIATPAPRLISGTVKHLRERRL